MSLCDEKPPHLSYSPFPTLPADITPSAARENGTQRSDPSTRPEVNPLDPGNMSASSPNGRLSAATADRDLSMLPPSPVLNLGRLPKTPAKCYLVTNEINSKDSSARAKWLDQNPVTNSGLYEPRTVDVVAEIGKRDGWSGCGSEQRQE